VLSRPAAAKTGTTNDWTDNWTVGYTPQLVTGVWTGNADRSPMINVIGITGAAPIWHDFMEGAFKIMNVPVEPFVAPPNVITTNQCREPGSNAVSGGTTDLAVPTSGSPLGALLPQDLPLCSLPDRGYMPIPCSQYPNEPNTFSPICAYPGAMLPFGAQSPLAPGSTETGPNTYTYGPTPVVPYNPAIQPPGQSAPAPAYQPPVAVQPPAPPANTAPPPAQPSAPSANSSPQPGQPSAPPILNPPPP
jgi:membrane peptidoglycan carboxypeptidase